MNFLQKRNRSYAQMTQQLANSLPQQQSWELIQVWSRLISNELTTEENAYNAVKQEYDRFITLNLQTEYDAESAYDDWFQHAIIGGRS